MATEFCSVNYITHHLERLPIADSYRTEKLSNLFYYRNFNDGYHKSSSKNGVSDMMNSHNNRSMLDIQDTRPENKTWKHEFAYEAKSTNTQSLEEIEERNPFYSIDNSLPELPDKPTFCNRAPLSNKRKRSCDSTDREAINDEEVKELVFGKSIFRRSNPSPVGHDFRPFVTDGRGNESSVAENRFCKYKFREKRPALNFDVMQRRCKSTSWLSLKLKPSERKVLKFTPVHVYKCDGNSEELCLEDLRREAFFRPIAADLHK